MTVVCPNCSAESADGAAFCATCGTSLAHTCPSCGADAAPDAQFCANCGTALHQEEATGSRPAEERRVVSVLFADLAGFTERTERSDPEDVRSRLTVYHKTAREQVEAHGGRVEKLMGDGVFAVFGVPAAHEDDPERAVRAAIRLQEAVERLNEDDPNLALSVRVAVTTGEAIVQLDGEDQDRETIIGDVVNTASRLEAVAPPGGIVVDERTYLASRSMISYDDLDSVDLKGKADATAIWLATGTRARQGVAVEESHRGPFVGRDPERAVLIDSLDRTIGADTVQLVTVIGEPGAGKSRLLHEFKAVLDNRTDTFWWKQGRCLPYGEGITFWALGEIVKAQAGILESDTEVDADRKLNHAVTTLIDDPTQTEWMVSRLSLLAGGSMGGQQIEQGELFSAWLQFFEGMAHRHPLVMVVEDIHWADEALLDFLEYLTEWAVDVPILLVTAARPELLANRPTWGGGVRNAATISLSPLANDDAATLLAALLDRAVLPAETQQVILERAGGNPLYVTEFVRLAADSDLLDESGNIDDLALPDSVQAIIAARLDLLGTEEKELLQAAAVMGKVFWSGALAALRPSAHSAATVRELVRREMVRPIRDPSMRGQEEYAFVHALVRDVAYGQIARDDRAEMHQAAATWIEAVSGERGVDVAELLAYHLGEAMELTTDPDADLRTRAYRALMQAGERARGLNPTQGSTYYAKAVGAADDDLDRARALMRAGEIGQTDVEQSERRVQEAHDLFAAAGDLEGQAEALVVMAGWAWWRGDTERAMEQNDEAVRLLEDRPDSEAKAAALVSNVSKLFIRGLDAEAVAAADAAAPVVNSAGSAEDQIKLLSTRGAAYANAGLGEEGLDDMATAMGIADDRNFTFQSGTIRNNLATMTHQLGSPQDAVAIIDEGIELVEERGLPTSSEWLRFTKSEILIWTGDWDESVALAEEVVRRDDERGGSQAGGGARSHIGVIQHYQGVDNPSVDWGDLIDNAREVQDQQVLAPVIAIAVTMAYDAGDEAEAIRLADEYNDTAIDVYRTWFLPWVTGPLARIGDVDRIGALIEGSAVIGSHAKVGKARAEGHLAEARGDFNGAAARFLDAIAVADEYRRPLDATLARIDAARVLSDDRLDEVIVEARQEAERMGANRLLDELDEIEGIEQSEAAGA
jgi:class 3 adenylate cyclase/tetratricopeptide (TPR) repeat protein